MHVRLIVGTGIVMCNAYRAGGVAMDYKAGARKNVRKRIVRGIISLHALRADAANRIAGDNQLNPGLACVAIQCLC